MSEIIRLYIGVGGATQLNLEGEVSSNGDVTYKKLEEAFKGNFAAPLLPRVDKIMEKFEDIIKVNRDFWRTRGSYEAREMFASLY